jgi:hypothetical protein
MHGLPPFAATAMAAVTLREAPGVAALIGVIALVIGDP